MKKRNIGYGLSDNIVSSQWVTFDLKLFIVFVPLKRGRAERKKKVSLSLDWAHVPYCLLTDHIVCLPLANVNSKKLPFFPAWRALLLLCQTRAVKNAFMKNTFSVTVNFCRSHFLAVCSSFVFSHIMQTFKARWFLCGINTLSSSSGKNTCEFLMSYHWLNQSLAWAYK